MTIRRLSRPLRVVATVLLIVFAVAAVTFTGVPASYRSWIFRVFMVAITLTLFLSVFFIRMRFYAQSTKRRFDERLLEKTHRARDLHDTLLQTIQGSKMVADDAREHLDDPRSTGRSIDRLSDWLDRASAEGRAALEALRTSTLDSNDLAGSLRRVAEDCLAGNATNIKVLTKGLPRNLQPIARDEIYRIAYEAIRNASVHSAATQLDCEISYRGNFQLDIRDNGHGMPDVQASTTGIGGKLMIRSSPDGTTVSFSVPGHAVYESEYGWSARLLDRILTRDRLQ